MTPDSGSSGDAWRDLVDEKLDTLLEDFGWLEGEIKSLRSVLKLILESAKAATAYLD